MFYVIVVVVIVVEGERNKEKIIMTILQLKVTNIYKVNTVKKS